MVLINMRCKQRRLGDLIYEMNSISILSLVNKVAAKLFQNQGEVPRIKKVEKIAFKPFKQGFNTCFTM